MFCCVFCPFYLFRFPVKGEYVDIHFVTSYHGFFSCHFDLVDYLCIVEWFFFHQRTVLWWCYVCNKLEMFKSVCCFDVINLGMVPEELVKTKKVVSSINISKWSAGSVHVKLKFCPAQNQVSYGTDFAKDWCNGGFHWPSSWQILSPCVKAIQSK